LALALRIFASDFFIIISTNLKTGEKRKLREYKVLEHSLQ